MIPCTLQYWFLKIKKINSAVLVLHKHYALLHYSARSQWCYVVSYFLKRISIMSNLSNFDLGKWQAYIKSNKKPMQSCLKQIWCPVYLQHCIHILYWKLELDVYGFSRVLESSEQIMNFLSGHTSPSELRVFTKSFLQYNIGKKTFSKLQYLLLIFTLLFLLT